MCTCMRAAPPTIDSSVKVCVLCWPVCSDQLPPSQALFKIKPFVNVKPFVQCFRC